MKLVYFLALFFLSINIYGQDTLHLINKTRRGKYILYENGCFTYKESYGMCAMFPTYYGFYTQNRKGNLRFFHDTVPAILSKGYSISNTHTADLKIVLFDYLTNETLFSLTFPVSFIDSSWSYQSGNFMINYWHKHHLLNIVPIKYDSLFIMRHIEDSLIGFCNNICINSKRISMVSPLIGANENAGKLKKKRKYYQSPLNIYFAKKWRKGVAMPHLYIYRRKYSF